MPGNCLECHGFMMQNLRAIPRHARSCATSPSTPGDISHVKIRAFAGAIAVRVRKSWKSYSQIYIYIYIYMYIYIYICVYVKIDLLTRMAITSAKACIFTWEMSPGVLGEVAHDRT